MTRTKKPKPSFDVARDPIGETKSGWVYRSAPEETPPVVTAELLHPADYMLEPAGSLSAPPEPPGWVSTGLLLMMLPITVGVSVMLAPVSWMLSGRTRR